MKVVLFCGGFGMRLREYPGKRPKPLMNVGHRPILWHLMKYYAYFGHKEFILCLGWQGDAIRSFFDNYESRHSRNEAPHPDRIGLNPPGGDVPDWHITFVDTGLTANIGQRLKQAAPHVQGTRTFLANYTDGLTDLNLPDLIALHVERQFVGTFLAVPPTLTTFHTVKTNADSVVESFAPLSQADMWINGGFFVFSDQIFQYIEDGDELVEAPFQRLIANKGLGTLKYDGFWGCMDTHKEREMLNDIYSQGSAPWEVWRQPPTAPDP